MSKEILDKNLDGDDEDEGNMMEHGGVIKFDEI